MNDLELKALIKLLGETLILAKEHLEYCGYGNSWERECALAAKLEDKIEDAWNNYILVKDQI